MTTQQDVTSRQRWTLVAAVTGSALVFLDATVVTVALPQIGQALPTPRFGVLEAQAYVYNAYLLSLGSLLIIGGTLADVYGRRRLYLLGVLGFGLASLACGLAPTMEFLLVARLAQGIAAAVVVPGALAIITDAFEDEARGRAFGVWAGASAVTTILGPVVGGVLVDVVSWRAVFLLSVPVAGVALFAAYRHVRESRDPTVPRHVDWRGALLAVVALGGLTFGAIRGQEHLWQDPIAFLALAIGMAAVVAFIPSTTHSPTPLVPPELFRSRNFTAINVATVPIYGCLYVTMYFLVLFLQGTLGYNATAAGLATVPMVAFLAVFSTRIGILAARYGARWLLAAGPTLMGFGTLLLARVPASGDAWILDLSAPSTILPPTTYLVSLLPALVLFGLGIMLVVTPLTTTLMDSVPTGRAGIASAVNNALSRVGPQLTTAVLFVAVTATFYAGLDQRIEGFDSGLESDRASFAPLNPPPMDTTSAEVEATRAASTDAFQLAMIVATGMAWGGALVNGIGIRDHDRHVPPQRPAECLPGATPPCVTASDLPDSRR